jgi:hypothetical protein
MRASALTSIALAALHSFGLGCSSSTGSAGGSGASSGASGGGASASGVPANGTSGGLGSDAGVQSSGSTADDAGQASDAADASACAAYSGAIDSYSANLAKAGTSGVLQFVLVSAQPAPPGKGDNTWKLKLLDSAGAPVTNATFAIKTWMPMMHHGSSIAPGQAANPDGTYSISNLYLIMPGIWQVTFNAQSGAMKDTAVYTFCVSG